MTDIIFFKGTSIIGVSDIGDIKKVFTWDLGGAFTEMVTNQEVGRSDFLHSILDRDWYIIKLPPPLDIRVVCSYSGTEVLCWVASTSFFDSSAWQAVWIEYTHEMFWMSRYPFARCLGSC